METVSNAANTTTDQFIIDEQQLRSMQTTSIAGIRFFDIEQSMKIISIFKAQPENVKLPTNLVTIDQVEFKELNLLYDIEILNAGDYDNPTERPNAYVVLKLKKYIQDLIDYEQFAYADRRFDNLNKFISSARMFTALATRKLKMVNTMSDNEASAIKLVDMSTMGERNMLAIKDKITNPLQAAAYFRAVNRRYVEEDPPNLPDYALPKTEQAYWGEELAEFTRVTLPLTELEKSFIDLADTIFKMLYTHPAKVVDDALEYQTQFVTISNESYEKAHTLKASGRVIVPVLYRYDVDNAYLIPSVISEMRAKISEMVAIAIMTTQPTEKIMRYRNVLRIDRNRDQSINRFDMYVNVQSLSYIMSVAYSCCINVNLYKVRLNSLKADMFVSNPFDAISILLIQLIFPPNCIDESDRRFINNALAYALCDLVITSDSFTNINRQLEIARQQPLPESGSSARWADSRIDFLRLLYRYGYVILIRNSEELALEILSLYYNGVNFDLIAEQDPNGESMSIVSPWLMGRSTDEYLVDVEFADVRDIHQMRRSGAVLLNTQLDSNKDPDMTFFMRKLSILNKLWLESRNKLKMKSILSDEQTRAIIRDLEMNGATSFGMIYRYFNHHRPKYTTSIVVDPVVRPGLHIFNKEIKLIDPKYMFTATLIFESDIVLNSPIMPSFYDGSKHGSEMLLFLACYRHIKSLVTYDDNTLLTGDQTLKQASELVSIIIGREYDPKVQFGYASSDVSTWKAFLASNVPVNQIPLFSHFMTLVRCINGTLSNTEMLSGMVDHFYLVKDAIMGPNLIPTAQNRVFAASTVPFRKLKVVFEINSYTDYLDWVRVDQHNNVELYSKQEHMWEEGDMVTTVNHRALYDGDYDTIPAIKVNMNARVLLNLIKEDGSFQIHTDTKHCHLDDFIRNMNNKDNDMRLPKAMTIPINVIMNNINDSLNSGPILRKYRKAPNCFLDSLGTTQVIVPYEELPLRVMSLESLPNFMTQQLTLRKKPYEILDDFKIDYEYTGYY